MVIPLSHHSPDWEHKEDEDREDHLEEGHGSEPNPTEHCQLKQLQDGEEMNLSLGHPTDVVVGWVLGLNINTQVCNTDSHVTETLIIIIIV